MDPSLGWEEPEVRGKRSEERRDLDFLTSSLIPLTSDAPRRRLPKNEEQILALERTTGSPRRTVQRSTSLLCSFILHRDPNHGRRSKARTPDYIRGWGIEKLHLIVLTLIADKSGPRKALGTGL